jgi:hypothetical protein
MLAGLKVKRLLLFSIVNKAVGIPDSSPLSLWMSTLGEDTTERGDRGWKEAQREGENRVTLRITLWCVWGVLFLLYCVCGVFFLAPSTLMLPGDVSERLAIMVSKVVRGGLLETWGVVRKPSLFGPPLWMLVSMWKFSLFQSKFPIQLSHCGLWLWWTGTPHGNWARDNLHMWACCVKPVPLSPVLCWVKPKGTGFTGIRAPWGRVESKSRKAQLQVTLHGVRTTTRSHRKSF